MYNIFEVRVGLPLVKDKVSYLVITGDEFQDGDKVTVSGDDFPDEECDTKYVKMPFGVPDLLVAKWIGPNFRPATGEVDVTITVKDRTNKEQTHTIRTVVQVIDGDLPLRRKPAKRKRGKAKKPAQETAGGGT